MQKKSFKIYNFVNEFNLSDLHRLSKDICIIYRNYDRIDHLENILKLKKYCKNIKTKFYLSNDVKLSIKLGLDGVYIPSFNKRINYVQNYKLPKNFDIIGSAHNVTEINLKLKQKCECLVLSFFYSLNQKDIRKYKIVPNKICKINGVKVIFLKFTFFRILSFSFYKFLFFNLFLLS